MTEDRLISLKDINTLASEIHSQTKKYHNFQPLKDEDDEESM